jgi:hypothetical protein
MRRTVAPHSNVTHATSSALKPPNVKPLTSRGVAASAANRVGVPRRQTTQIDSGDAAATDGGLREALGALTGTTPAGDEGGSDLTDPGDHPADDPRAPFAAKHPSPPDPRDPLAFHNKLSDFHLSPDHEK